MEEVNLCRLCLTSCNEFKSLYDNNGQVSQFYEIAVKYFDPKILDPGKSRASRLLCLECWKHIYDFHSYQQSIICAQSQLELVKPVKNVKLNQMEVLSTPDNDVTYEPISVFDIIHIDDKNHFTKSITSQMQLLDSVPGSVKLDKQLGKCEEINSVKRRKLRNDVPIAMCEGVLECVECNETFANYTLLCEHFKSEHPDQEWNTVCSDRKFNRVTHLCQYPTQIDGNSYNCECCPASFSKYLSLKKHILSKHTAEDLIKYISNFNSKSFKKQIRCNVKLQEDSTDSLPEHNIMEKDAEKEHSNDLQDNISIDSIDIDEIYEIFNKSPEKERSSLNLDKTANNDFNNESRSHVSDDSEINDNMVDTKYNNLEIDNLIAKLKGDLECTNCKENFAYFSLLNEHFISEHPNVECHILCCKSKFFGSSAYIKHLGQYHARKYKNEYSCKICGASFTQYGSLRRHIRRKHAVQSLIKWLCKSCNGTFNTRSSLESHKKEVHSKDKSNNYIEDYSEDEQKDQMQENICCSSEVSKNKDICEVDHKKDPLVYIPNGIAYSCVTPNDDIQQPPLEIIDVKDEIFLSSDNESVSNYPDNGTNALNVTNDSFCDIEENILEYDDFIAKWLGDLKCPKCIQMFPNFSSLDNHFHNEHQIHNGCYITCCQTRLNDRRLIVEHLREHHKDPLGHRCDVCGKGFKSDRSLASHKRQVHVNKRSKYHLHLCYCKLSKDRDSKNEELSENDYTYDTVICCERKQKTLEDDATIAKWKQELKCRLCEATFPFYSLMHAHFYYKHPGERCYIICCQRNFNRMSDALEHIRIHLDPNAFKCEQCDVRLSGRASLSKHMSAIHGETSTNKYACDQCSKSFSQSFILTRHKNAYHTKQDD